MHKYLVELLIIGTDEIEFVSSYAYSAQAAIIKVMITYKEDEFKVIGIYKEINPVDWNHRPSDHAPRRPIADPEFKAE